MRLIECYIENFGRLSDFKYTFTDGLNVIKRENGYGKTTLSVFIKAMFFGLDESRKARLETNERKRYLPWNGMRCGGALIFEANRKKYRIERSFGAKAADDTFKLYDLSNGKPSDDFSKNIGEELFEIDEDGFERTVFLSEANLSGRTENKSIASKLSELVECEGDIGAMDNAVKLLENQRKAYYRRGGGGEIGSIKELLTETELKISELNRTKKALAEEEEALRDVTTELGIYKEKQIKLQNEAKAADAARTKRIYEKQYLEMKKALDKDKESLDELNDFFKESVPEPCEVERIREMSVEAKKIKETYKFHQASHSGNASENAFSDISDKELEAAKALSEAIKAKKRECEMLEKRIDEQIISSSHTPALSEAERHISSLSKIADVKNVNKCWYFLLPMSIIVTVAGTVLAIIFHIALGLFALLGAGLLIISVLRLKNAKKLDTARASEAQAILFARTFKPQTKIDSSNVLSVLYELRGEAVASENAQKESAALALQLSRINEEISESEHGACEFLSHFPATGASSIPEAVDEILSQAAIQKAVADAAKYNLEKERQELLSAEQYSEAVSEFIGKFRTTTSRPLDEISSKIIEYNTLIRTIDRTKESIDAFVLMHGINTEELSCENMTDYVPNPDNPTLLAKLSELEKKKALLERQCQAYSEETDRIDELTALHSEYSEKLARAQRILEINQKTQRFLSEAKDSLTAKYISKTKAAFDKYISEITNDINGNYEMNTSFAVSKIEHGTLRDTVSYSRGTRDVQHLATRLALIDSLYEKEEPFVILDDPFAYLDDAKLHHALCALEKIAHEKQIIYFTCQNARMP